MNADGSTTKTVPVAGKLGALGDVRGVWRATFDAFGNHTGLDALRLHDAKGTFVIQFNNLESGPAHHLARGAIYYEQAQRLSAGTGPYAGASEHGTIELILNSDRTVVTSFTLNSKTA
jgi:hypothetical protein